MGGDGYVWCLCDETELMPESGFVMSVSAGAELALPADCDYDVVVGSECTFEHGDASSGDVSVGAEYYDYDSGVSDCGDCSDYVDSSDSASDLCVVMDVGGAD